MRVFPTSANRGRSALAAMFLLAFSGTLLATSPPPPAEEDDDEEEEVVVPSTPCARQAHEDGETPRAGAFRVDVDDACVAISGTFGVSLQQVLSSRGDTGRELLRPPGAGPNAPAPSDTQPSARASFSFDVTRFTEIGRVATSIGGAWSWTRGDGTSAGSFQFSEISLAVGGAKLGYAASLTSFFEGDLLATAFTPARSVGLVSYEHAIAEGTRIAVAVETGAATGEAATRLVPVSFASNPYLVMRLQHDLARGSLHLAGAVTRSEGGRFGFSRASTGFAVTAGGTWNFDVAGREDGVSVQVAYAREALPYLGTAVDLAGIFPRLADFGSAQGMSIVASYTRNWSEAWASTAFVSALAVDGISPNAVRARSLRYGANLFWQASDTLRLGAEVSMAHSRVERVPIPRRLRGGSGDGDAVVLLLSATVSF